MSQFKFSTEARSASRTALRTKLLQENEACEGKVQLDNGDSINVQSLSISDLVKCGGSNLILNKSISL